MDPFDFNGRPAPATRTDTCAPVGLETVPGVWPRSHTLAPRHTRTPHPHPVFPNPDMSVTLPCNGQPSNPD
ncbi:hypothetical protein GCM10010215_58840 [Streptomyces virginiae]|uniref:Uncharacterized protein n=1 Tax=Streptomyces virginiae TaxID=1961 RepID=A0ABQ3NQA6_STRVG|nr:hypothetical protein GCM10010215_58840 [Streptomyces virginiae]GHI14926.1 hypothetical protein Scinn_43890 [Streptomyces virginiae]GLV95862.1 hypothetical protein Slala04_73150 [Streptomyces lavendulae subsp. lavendulae]